MQKHRWWALYYFDGPGQPFRLITSNECAPEDTPRDGVVAVLQEDLHTNVQVLDRVAGGDYFIFRVDHYQWYASDELGWITNHAPNVQHVTAVRFGTYIPNDDFARLLKQMREDSRIPTKAGYWRGERRPVP